MDSLEIEREHNLLTHVHHLVEDLPVVRLQAKDQIEIVQDRQKEMYDKKINKEQHFQIGQKVLYFKAAQDKQHTGKFLPKWKGPYLIHAVQPHGSYKISTADGKILKSPVNGVLLKLYHE